MNKIYDKINAHKILNNDDIKEFVNFKTNGAVKVNFVNEFNHSMAYDYKTSSILINQKFRSNALKFLIIFTGSNVAVLKNSNSHFLIDLYNIYLINSLLHELRHYKQFDEMIKVQTYRSKIIKSSEEFIHYNPTLYSKNHDLYYNEYDAVITSLIETLYIIENKCYNLNKNSISEFNRVAASIIYHSYGYKYPIDACTYLYDKFTCPIKYTQYLSNCWCNSKDKKVLNVCIKNLLKQSKTQYSKLINGFEPDDEVMELIYNVCIREIITQNILNDIREIDNKITSKRI